MSADSGGGAGRREVAYRLFAAEYDDAELEHSESDEERAPNYVVTPTGARVNRLFVVGVLTEVESVSEDVLRGRVVDPTGAFVLYAGQYQPDARAFLDRAEPPTFVAVTGKARVFRPDGSDRVLTSIRPESISEVDADTRDRWTVGAAERTIDRVGTFAAALDRPERGEDLREALLEAGVDAGLAAGIPLAIEHYGTTPAYLDAVRGLALDAAEVVAGEREEVSPLEVEPDEGGGAPVPAADLGTEAGERAEPGAGSAPPSGGAAPGPSNDDGSDGDGTAPAPESDIGADDATPSPAPGAGGDEAEATPAPDAEGESPDEPAESAGDGDPVDGGAPAAEGGAGRESEVEPDAAANEAADDGDGGEPAATDPEGADGSAVDVEGGAGGAAGDGDLGDFEEFGGGEESAEEMYEFDEGEREAIEEEYGTEFSTGAEVDAPGEADIETPDPEPEAGTEPDTGADEGASGAETGAEPGGDESPPGTGLGDEPGTGTAVETGSGAGADATGGDESGDGSPDEPVEEGAKDEPAGGEVDVEEAVVDEMRGLDSGDGAARDAVIDAVVSAYGVAEADVEDAIQDALMSGKCYEPDEGRLKPI